MGAQLVAVYQSAPPDMVSVIINAKGFADLIEQVDQLKRIGTQNASVVSRLKAEKTQVTTQADVLTAIDKERRASSAPL